MKDTVSHDRLNPLLDIDYLIYRAGFAADTQAKEQFGPEHYLEENYCHWAIGNTKTAVENLLRDVFPKRYWYRMFLGGTGNYRSSICKALPRVETNPDGSTWTYKGNRDSLHKPKYYAELREYLVEQWGAELVDGRESDDEVSILQWAHPDGSTCIVGIDKDLDNTPGWHYNPTKKEFRYITMKEANLNYAKQILSGDRSDNIPGLEGIADIKALKVLKDCQYNPDEIKRATERMYRNQYGPALYEEVLHENKMLLWIQRESWKCYRNMRIECQWTK